MVAKGYYRHYKGGMYQVIEVGRHTETEEEFVVYRDVSDRIWLRPLEMWKEKVGGVSRFELFKDEREGSLHFELAKKEIPNSSEKK